MRGLAVLLLLVICTLLPALAGGEIYQWVDEEGTIHYASDLDRVPERYRPEARTVPVPTAPAGAAPGSASRTTTIPFTPGAAILVSARINGAGPVTLVLDTGADRTVVSPATLWRLGIATPGTGRARIKGVTGESQADVVWVGSIEVGGAAVGPLAIVAHDADLRQADGLLGRDFLASFTVTIDATANLITLTRD